ncbi:MAG: alkaline phosphatase family protein [Silvibacterium sp.]|nr:alkaline phosphatase family protein [Silvibacterium sp.]MBV8435902.1 alkaline phosphatase family protein [Silvibacterium sp.]
MNSLVRRVFFAALLCFVCRVPLLAQEITPVIAVDHGSNGPEQQQKHYVVMVSLDGFRYDYAKKYGAKHILGIGAKGASAPEGMIPSYPSLTFPNHYTLVTGLYPEHHGIVANSFYDPDRKAIYSYRDPKAVTDGSWYGGAPLWSLAEKQGMRSACFFWPGSEAEIAGERPSYYLHFDNKIDDNKRIDQVIAWLKLSPEQRPHFITLYYSDVDHAGHEHGPNSPQVAEAVKHVDELMGRLEKELDALHLQIDLIILADHGMEKVQGDWITLDKYVPLDDVQTVGSLLYPQTEADTVRIYKKLRAADAGFLVYRRAQVPAELHYNSNPREGDPVIIPKGPALIRATAPPAGQNGFLPLGEHGYNPYEMTAMRAIFFAEGPDIRHGVTLKPFENVNVFPVVAKILGLESPKVDGSVNVLSTILVPSADVEAQQ